MLEVNTGLTSLKLSMDDSHDNRVRLMQAMVRNRTLLSIKVDNLPSTNSSHSYREALNEVLAENRDLRDLRESLPAAAAGLELASGLAYPAELMSLILKQMIYSPDVPKQAAVDTILGLLDSLDPPLNQPGSQGAMHAGRWRSQASRPAWRMHLKRRSPAYC